MKKLGKHNDCMCWRMLYSRAPQTAGTLFFRSGLLKMNADARERTVPRTPGIFSRAGIGEEIKIQIKGDYNHVELSF